MSEPATLSTWTIFFNPLDAPGRFVVRRFDIVQGHPEPVPAEASVHFSLQSARDAVPNTVVICFPRSPGDDPAIVETWM